MKSMNNHKQGGKMSRGAFTLVEVAIATALLGMTLALFLGAFVQSKRSAVIANNRMAAIENARSNMENLVSSAYDDPAALSTGAHPSAGTLSTVPTNISYFVAIVTQSPSIVVKNIYVTNRWINPGSGITSTVSLAGSVSQELHP